MKDPSIFFRYLRASYAVRFAALAALFGLLFAAMSVVEWRHTSRRMQGFYQMQATLMSKYARGGGRSGPSYFLLVQYLDRAGRQHARPVLTTRKQYTGSRLGDRIELYVSEVDPEDAWLVASGEPNFRRTAVFGVFGAVFLAPVFVVLEWLRRRVTVLRLGQPVAGRVEKVRRDYRGRVSSKYKYQVLWSCTGPNGRQHKGKSLHLPKQLAEKWKRGDQIEVYFHPAYPWIAEIDVYAMRRPAC